MYHPQILCLTECFCQEKRRQPKEPTNENKISTEINIANAKNERRDTVYQKKKLESNKLPVVFLQKKIDEAGKNITYQTITK